MTLTRTAFLAALLCTATAAQAQQQAGPYQPRPGQPVEGRPANATDQTPAFPNQTRAPYTPTFNAFTVETLVDGIVDPWGLAFMPDGRMLLTERDGRIRILSDGVLSAPVAGLPKTTRQEISGMADVILDPDFARNSMIYWTYVEGRPEGNMLSVARGRLVDGAAPRVEDVKVIYRQLPSLPSEHGNFGARMLFDDTGALFVTLGDLASTPLRPYIQQLDNGIGKIVRITTDGDPAPGNPWAGQDGVNPELWAVGFRNPLGLAFRPGTDELWEIDVGPRGGDELNIIKPGANYGWPVISYGNEYSGEQVGEGPVKTGLEQPVYYWDPVISPSSLAFYSGDLIPEWKGDAFVTSLSQMHLVRLKLEGDRVVGEERLLGERRERLRLVKQAPDGSIYVLTDGAQGKLLRIAPPGR